MATVLPGVAKSRGDTTTENVLSRGDTTTENVPVANAPFSAPQTAENALKACNLVSVVPAAPIALAGELAAGLERTPDPEPEQKSHASDAAASAPAAFPTEARTQVRHALQAFDVAIKGKRTKTTLVDWISSYLAAHSTAIAPKRLAALIAQERKYCVQTSHELSRAKRVIEHQIARALQDGHKSKAAALGYELAAIIREYEQRGLDPNAPRKVQQRRVPTPPLQGYPQPLPLLDPPPPNPAPEPPVMPAVVAPTPPTVPTVQNGPARRAPRRTVALCSLCS